MCFVLVVRSEEHFYAAVYIGSDFVEQIIQGFFALDRFGDKAVRAGKRARSRASSVEITHTGMCRLVISFFSRDRLASLRCPAKRYPA